LKYAKYDDFITFVIDFDLCLNMIFMISNGPSDSSIVLCYPMMLVWFALALRRLDGVSH